LKERELVELSTDLKELISKAGKGCRNIPYSPQGY
jgi:hypothetical protein